MFVSSGRGETHQTTLSLSLSLSRPVRRPGFVPGRYAPEVLLPATLDPTALIQRWKQYTQWRAASRFLRESLRRRHLHRVVRVAFDGWRTGLGPKQRREAAAMKAAMAAATGGRSEAPATPTISGALGQPVGRTARQDAAPRLVEAEEEEEEEEEERDLEEGEHNGDDGVYGGNDDVDEMDHAGGREERSRQRRRRQEASSIECRAKIDLAAARRTVIAGWKTSLPRTIGIRQAKQEHLVKKQARRHPT